MSVPSGGSFFLKFTTLLSFKYCRAQPKYQPNSNWFNYIFKSLRQRRWSMNSSFSALKVVYSASFIIKQIYSIATNPWSKCNSMKCNFMSVKDIFQKIHFTNHLKSLFSSHICISTFPLEKKVTWRFKFILKILV